MTKTTREERLTESYVKEAVALYGMDDGKNVNLRPAIILFQLAVGQALSEGKDEVTLPIVDAALVAFALSLAQGRVL